MSKIKGSTANGNSFLYALIENDVLAGKVSDETETAAADTESDETDTSEFEGVGSQIRSELDAWNSDEEKLISLYNGVVKSQKDASAFAKWYQQSYNVDVIKDLDRALSDKELDQLQYK